MVNEITVNGVTGTLMVEEVFASRFGGHVTAKRPTYRVRVAHGKYADVVGNYTSKKLVDQFAAADAEAFLAKIYKPVAPVVEAPAPVAAADVDLLAILFGEN